MEKSGLDWQPSVESWLRSGEWELGWVELWLKPRERVTRVTLVLKSLASVWCQWPGRRTRGLYSVFWWE